MSRSSPRGWGSVLPFRDGYRASIYIDGRRERKVVATKGEAAAWLKAKRARKLLIEAGAMNIPGEAEDVRFRDLRKRFRERLAAGFRRVPTARTLSSHRWQAEQVFDEFGSRRVASVSERDVAAYVTKLRRAGLSTSSIRHRLDRLAQILRFAAEQGYIARVPCEVRRPAVVLRSRPDAATEEEVDRLVRAAKRDPTDLAVVLLAADGGLRREEIRRLRPEDVYRDHVHVAVRSEIDRTKSGKGRDVPILTGRLRDALHGAVWAAWPRGDWTMRALSLRLGGAARVRWHPLRHRFVTRLLEDGVPLVKVQAWAGHSTPAVTMRYAHLDPLDVPEAAYGALEGHSGATKVPRGTSAIRRKR